MAAEFKFTSRQLLPNIRQGFHVPLFVPDRRQRLRQLRRKLCRQLRLCLHQPRSVGPDNRHHESDIHESLLRCRPANGKSGQTLILFSKMAKCPSGGGESPQRFLAAAGTKLFELSFALIPKPIVSTPPHAFWNRDDGNSASGYKLLIKLQPPHAFWNRDDGNESSLGL